MATGSGKTLAGRHRALPADQVRRRAARALPGRPREPRRAGREGVPGLPHARRQPEVHRAVQRPAAHLEHHRRLEQGRHHDDPAALLDAEGRARARPRGWRRTRSSRRRRGAEGAAPGRLQPGHPARVLRRHLHRRVPPLDLLALAAGAGVLRRLPVGLTATPPSTPSASSTRTSSWSTPTSRRSPTASTCDFEVYRIRTQITEQGSTIEAEPGTMVGYRDRQTRKLRWEAPDEDVTYGADDSTATSSPRTRSGSSSARSATSCSRRSSPAAPRCPRR